MAKIQNIFRVTANKKICPQFYCLCLEAPSIARKIHPGQFLHIHVADDLTPFFRRPFSVYRAKKDIEIFYEIVGPGTKILSQKKKGETLDVLGPLGKPFTLPSAKIKHVVMIAGGIGVAPFLILSDVLKKRTNLTMTLLYGGRTKGHVYPFKEFKDNGCTVRVATDDGSVGTKGRVSKLFKHLRTNAGETFIYTCGPRPMMAAAQHFAKTHGIPGEAACEEVMACALGACLGCSIQTTRGYKTVCYDGPVFDLQEVLF